MRTIRKASLLAVAVSMAISGQVNAQRSTTTEIEEVLVTAQKREENMQDVAISMSAMDANAIEKSFARTIDEITGMSPNLIINPILGNGTVGVSIRGMQHAEVEKSFDPAVAIYQDGIYLSSTTVEPDACSRLRIAMRGALLPQFQMSVRSNPLQTT
jgi:iron complex outermembrane receptor protein